MPHSCGAFSVANFLKMKDPHAVALYKKFSAVVHGCGPVRIALAKTRIGFQVRMIFAAVNKLDDRGLEAHVVLTRKLRSPRFKRIEMMTPKCYVHHFRVERLADFDDELTSWLREAYEVGTQKHLEKSR